MVAEAAARALTTVRRVMPPRLRLRLDLLRLTAVQPTAGRDADQLDTRVLMDLSDAVHAREELRFDYAQTREAPADGPRRVQPHPLVTWRGHWYLVAWDLGREDWWIFRADRISPRTPTGPRFLPHEIPGSSFHDFVLSRFRGDDGTSTDWPCRGEVILDLPVADVTPFAQDGVVEELGARRCRVSLGAWSWIGLAVRFGRFDADFHVIGPPRLRRACADLAARYANAARNTADSTQSD